MKCLNPVLAFVAGVCLADGISAEPGPPLRRLNPPEKGPINVAVVVSDDADIMDIAGAWEVFSDTMINSRGEPWSPRDGDDGVVTPFHVYSVSDSVKPLSAGGLTIVPSYDFAHAPEPQVIVVGAQHGRSAAQRAWLLAHAPKADVTMSVCTGAAVLANDGLLDGLTATSHHLYLEALQKKYPAVHFVRGVRFVEHDKISTAGGLTSGIDLALHVVERYYGKAVAQGTADYLEYRGDLWNSPDEGAATAVIPEK